MGESRDPDDEQASAYLRVPWPIAALGLVLLIGVAAAFGVYVNGNARSQATSNTSAPVENRGQTTGSALVPTLEVVQTATPAPTLPPTTLGTPGPAIGLLTATPAGATPTSTLSPELAQEISAAYKHYWDVLAEAMITLDTSHLNEAMAGDQLMAVQGRIAELKEEQRGIQVNVDHSYAIVEASGMDAKVSDIYRDESFYVDLPSGKVVTAPADEPLSELYTLSKTDGTWRVVDLVRFAS